MQPSFFHDLNTPHLFPGHSQGQYIVPHRKMPRAVKAQRMFPLFKRLILNKILCQFSLQVEQMNTHWRWLGKPELKAKLFSYGIGVGQKAGIIRRTWI